MGFFKKQVDPQEEIFNIKFTMKQLGRNAVKADKEEKKQKIKVRKALEGNDPQSARVYATGAIRKKADALQYRRMEAQLDAVVSVLERQAVMGGITANIAALSRPLDAALDAGKVDESSMVINKFMSQMEDLEVQSAYMEETMSGSAATTADVGQVDGLVAEIAAEHQLDFQSTLAEGAPAMAAKPVEMDPLQARMAKL